MWIYGFFFKTNLGEMFFFKRFLKMGNNAKVFETIKLNKKLMPRIQLKH